MVLTDNDEDSFRNYWTVYKRSGNVTENRLLISHDNNIDQVDELDIIQLIAFRPCARQYYSKLAQTAENFDCETKASKFGEIKRIGGKIPRKTSR